MLRLTFLSFTSLTLLLFINFTLGDLSVLRDKHTDDDKSREGQLEDDNELEVEQERTTPIAPMRPYHKKFLDELKSLRDSIYHKKTRKNEKYAWKDSLEESAQRANLEVTQTALKVDHVVDEILKENKGKMTGVGRKAVPVNFVSMTNTENTLSVLNEIVEELRFVLMKTMGCRGCYQPHAELQAFLEWLVTPSKSSNCETKQEIHHFETNTECLDDNESGQAQESSTEQAISIKNHEIQRRFKDRTRFPFKQKKI